MQFIEWVNKVDESKLFEDAMIDLIQETGEIVIRTNLTWIVEKGRTKVVPLSERNSTSPGVESSVA